MKTVFRWSLNVPSSNHTPCKFFGKRIIQSSLPLFTVLHSSVSRDTQEGSGRSTLVNGQVHSKGYYVSCFEHCLCIFKAGKMPQSILTSVSDGAHLFIHLKAHGCNVLKDCCNYSPNGKVGLRA